MANTPQDKINRRARVIYAAECYRRGMSNIAILEHLKQHYGVCEKTARKFMKQAMEWLCSYDDCDFIKEVKAKQVARAELCLEKAIEERRWQVANSIIDTLNKMLGIYEDKQKIEISTNEIQFKFGGVNDSNSEESKSGEEQIDL